MATRPRPEGCCPLRPVRPLPAAEQERLVAAFKALADPTRLEILRLVAAQPGPVCVCDVVDRFALAQPTISHHLKVLRVARIVQSRKEGRFVSYSLHPNVFVAPTGPDDSPQIEFGCCRIGLTTDRAS